MTLNEFRNISQIYGAEVTRWPSCYREKINTLSETQFAEMRKILNEEASLDELLATYQIEPPSRQFFEQIIAGAPKAELNLWRFMADWLSFRVIGIGLTTALTGAICVSIWTTQLTSNLSSDGTTNTAENIDYGQDWLG
jgi:hypothetical protein